MSDRTKRARVRNDVLIEHLEELDFLWEQRERFIFARDWTIRDLAALEERAEAHLDGLRIGAEAAIEIARPFLLGDEKGAATAAAFTLLACSDRATPTEILEALRIAPTPARDGIRIALRHSDLGPMQDGLYDLGVGSDATLRALAADVLSFQRLPLPPEIDTLLNDADPMVRALGLGVAGRAGTVLTARHLRTALADDEALVRSAALEAAAHSAVRRLPDLCRDSASGFQPVVEAVEFLGVLGDTHDVQMLESCLREPTTASAAVQAMGDLGSVEVVPLLLEAMGVPALAEVAAASYTQVTGVEVPRRLISPSQSASEDDETEPLPDPEHACSEWEAARARFIRGRRYQSGQDIEALTITDVLQSLPLRSRWVAYLGRRLRDASGTPDVELEHRVGSRAPSRT